MKTVTIEVTQEDIEKGTVSDCFSCPIAIAVKRATKLECSVITRIVSWAFMDEYSELPTEATKFIHSFDTKLPVSPFTFQLEVPE